jgi:hypothetical protein
MAAGGIGPQLPEGNTLMPIRIYDIAKKLGIENKQVLAKARALGITSARVASSALSTTAAETLETELRASSAGTLSRGLHGFQLGNFKAFADTQCVPIRPLTLVFGANSSGTGVPSVIILN